MQYTPSAEATAILIRTLEAICRLNGKTLSVKTRADLGRACELLATGDDLTELLDDVPEPPRASPGEQAIDPHWAEVQRRLRERRSAAAEYRDE